MKEIQPDAILNAIYNEFIRVEIPNVIFFQEGLVWSNQQKKNDAVNEIKRKVDILVSYYESKSVRFFIWFKKLIYFIKNDIRQANSYRFKLSNSDISKVLNMGTLSDYSLRNEIIKQVYWDYSSAELSIENIFEGIIKYVPHFKMSNESSLLTWLKSQNQLYEVLPGKMVRKLK